MTRAPGLISRDVAAAAAFGSVALSGTLPLPVLIVFPVSLVLSLVGVRPLAGRRTAAVIALLVIGLLLFGAVALSTLDLVIAAVSFATLVTCHRMLADPTPQASRQVLLSGLLLVSGGAALTGEILFAVLLLIFFVAATWSLAWLVLGADHEVVDVDERRAISRQLIAGSAATLAMGLAFFLVFPRLSWNFASRRVAPGVGGVTGMSDTVKLGGGGDIKTSARVAFRVEIIPDPDKERLDAYFVGRHFDAFDGTEWTSTAVATAPAARIGLHRETPRINTVTQEYETTPAYGSRTLVALDTPTLFGRVRGLSVSGAQPMLLIHAPGDQVLAALDANSLTWSASSAPVPRIDRDEPSPAATRLPKQLDPRIRPLADRLSQGATGPGAIARTLEQELKRQYAYTLELPGDVGDPLADFLFTRKAGHCEDFATALAVMLRLEGIPSRITTGFFGGERSAARYVVRAGDAHAWVDAWVDGAWVRLDATPDAGRSLASGRWSQAIARLWEQIEQWWRTRVLDYSFSDQLNLARSLVRPPRSAVESDPATESGPVGDQRRSLGLAVLVIGALLAIVWWRRRGRTPPRHPASAFLDQIEARLRARGIDVDAAPLEELTAVLRARNHPVAVPLAAACRRYLEARFAGAPLSADERTRLLSALESPPA